MKLESFEIITQKDPEHYREEFYIRGLFVSKDDHKFFAVKIQKGASAIELADMFAHASKELRKI